jgi:hypothetical protein
VGITFHGEEVLARLSEGRNAVFLGFRRSRQREGGPSNPARLVILESQHTAAAKIGAVKHTPDCTKLRQHSVKQFMPCTPVRVKSCSLHQVAKSDIGNRNSREGQWPKINPGPRSDKRQKPIGNVRRASPQFLCRQPFVGQRLSPYLKRLLSGFFRDNRIKAP